MKKLFRLGLACYGLLFSLAPFALNAQVVLNEVLADNQTTLNNDGEFPDMVELFNTSTTATVDISNWHLTDDLANTLVAKTKFTFPPQTRIAPQGFLVVYCDDKFTLPGIHTGFSLKNDGEAVGLYDSAADPVLKDSITFGFQIPDKSIGRSPNGTGAWSLCKPTFGRFNVLSPLGLRAKVRINEWMAITGRSLTDVDSDWFELYNSDTNAVSLSGCVWSDQTFNPATNRALPALSYIPAHGFMRFFADEDITTSSGQPKYDHVDFKLSSTSGDKILFWSANRTTLLHRVDFGPQTLNVSEGWLPDGNTNNRVPFPVGRSTPGDSNLLPIPEIVINEVLAHTDLPLEDAIELHNITANEVDISNWWLSNADDDYAKFRIPANTKVPPFGFKVFYEFAGLPGGFNPNGAGTGRSFTLNSAHGDQVFLYAADSNGNLTGYRRTVDFTSSENGVSFGRYITSTGESDFVPMRKLTFGTSVTRDDPPSAISTFRTGQGATNSGPKIGPLVINEIHYHPPDVGTNDNSIDEYVEIYNPSTNQVFLFDRNVYDYPPYGNAYTNTWHVTGDIGFEFPTNISLLPGRSLLVVNFDPADPAGPFQLNAFRAKFGVPADVQVFGPYSSKLSNGGGTVRLERPDAPQGPQHPDFGYVPYLWVDWVKYNDKDPWPTQADGRGSSLYRLRPEEYGNDPINWGAGVPSPGWQPEVPAINPLQRSGNRITISFWAKAGLGYTVQASGNLSTWSKLADILSDTSGTRQVDDAITLNSARFYRVVTPMQP